MELNVNTSPKMLRETLCVAQAAIGSRPNARQREHLNRLQKLIDECDRHRPLGPDGKHDDLHTPTCGCTVMPPEVKEYYDDLGVRYFVAAPKGFKSLRAIRWEYPPSR